MAREGTGGGISFNDCLDRVHDINGADLDLGPGTPTYPDFPLDEYQARYARLQALMDDAEVDALVLTQEENVRYLSGYNSVIWAVGRWLPGVFLATRDPAQAVLLPHAFDIGAASGTAWVGTIDGLNSPSEVVHKVGEHLDRLGLGGRVGLEVPDAGSIMQLPYPVAHDLVTSLGDRAMDASWMLSTIRMLKSERELERVRHIVRATTAGYRAGIKAAKVGMTERQLVATVASEMYQHGASAGTRPVFLNCVAGLDRYPLVDTVASDRPFASGDVVFLDGGAGRDGYMSDIIRLIGIGDLSDSQERFATLASEATAATLAAMKPGMTASAVFSIGRDIYADAGLGEFTGGISGHGIGLEIWERPFIRDHAGDRSEDITLRTGMTLCIEPILMPVGDDGVPTGVFVVEQQVQITDTGADVLSGDLEAGIFHVT